MCSSWFQQTTGDAHPVHEDSAPDAGTEIVMDIEQCALANGDEMLQVAPCILEARPSHEASAPDTGTDRVLANRDEMLQAALCVMDVHTTLDAQRYDDGTC